MSFFISWPELTEHGMGQRLVGMKCGNILRLSELCFFRGAIHGLLSQMQAFSHRCSYASWRDKRETIVLVVLLFPQLVFTSWIRQRSAMPIRPDRLSGLGKCLHTRRAKLPPHSMPVQSNHADDAGRHHQRFLKSVPARLRLDVFQFLSIVHAHGTRLSRSAIHFNVSRNERPQQPWPHRPLMVSRIAAELIALVRASISRVRGAKCPQADRC